MGQSAADNTTGQLLERCESGETIGFICLDLTYETLTLVCGCKLSRERVMKLLREAKAEAEASRI